MTDSAEETRFTSSSSSETKCLICSQVINGIGNLRRQIDSSREESGVVLHQIARLLQVSSNIYHETDLDALPVPLVCSSCHETVSSGLELQEVIGKLQAELQRLTEMVKWYFIRGYRDNSDLFESEEGNECQEMKRIRKTYAQCLASQSPFYPFSDVQKQEEIKIEVELNPNHFQYDACPADGFQDINHLVDNVPETSDVNSEFKAHSSITSNFAPQSGAKQRRTEDSGLHDGNDGKIENLSTVCPELVEEKFHVQQGLQNFDLNGQLFSVGHEKDSGGDMNALVQEPWTEDTLGMHFMSFNQSSVRAAYDDEQTLETDDKSKSSNSSYHHSSSSESDSDSDYQPSSSRSMRRKPKKKVSLAKKLSTGMNDTNAKEKEDTARFSSMSEAIAHNSHEHYSHGNMSQKTFGHGALSCTMCKQMFYCKDRYDFHMRQHANPEEAISIHIQTTLDQDKNLMSFQCKLCSKNFSKESFVTSRNNVRISCQHGNCSCKTVFRDFTEFMYHHKNICTKAYWRNRETVKKRCVCDQCGTVFGSPQSLIVHQRCKHSKEKTGCFMCNVCGVKFSDQNIMKNHIARCYPPITFVCQFCYQMCGRQDILNAHLLTHHPEKTLHLHHQA